MPRHSRQPTKRGQLQKDNNQLAETINRAVAALSFSLVYGDGSEERREHLKPLTPSPSREVVAAHPRLAEVLNCAPGFLFAGAGLSATEQKLTLVMLDKMGFSPFGAVLQVLSRIPRIENDLRELEQRGIPKIDLLAALLMIPEEVQLQAVRILRSAKQQVGQQIGYRKRYIISGRILKLDPELLRLVEADIDGKIELRRTVQQAVDQFLAATKDVPHPTKSPLVREPKVRITQTLLKHDFRPADRLPGDLFPIARLGATTLCRFDRVARSQGVCAVRRVSLNKSRGN